jgi:DNA invertase Pin-like site-specific DNA recombinase
MKRQQPHQDPRGRVFGYARVSTSDQDLSVQIDALKAAGCDLVREEKVSGTSRSGRTELETLLAFLRDGDTLVVTRIDRLARSVKDLQDIVYDMRAKGVGLKATEQPIDTSTPAGKAFLDMLGVFAEFETALRRERQMEGISKARAKGVYKGRKPDLPRDAIKAARAEGMTPSAIAAQFGVARSSVYRVLDEAEA